MTTYTVYSPASGTVYGENLTAEQAAELILTFDGNVYDIRRTERYWCGHDLFVSINRDKSYMAMPAGRAANRLIWSAKNDPDEAWSEIALQVIDAAWRWRNCPVAVPTEDYNATMAEAAAE